MSLGRHLYDSDTEIVLSKSTHMRCHNPISFHDAASIDRNLDPYYVLVIPMPEP